ncbi:MAG: hypothetical protein FWH12_09705 [Treponema sp.]|nr:hypothetical protein [Treponema sp.]
MALISVDDGLFFNTIAQALNKVFGKKTKSGKPYKSVQKCCFEINKGKKALFIWLAEKRPEGGWNNPKANNNWLNIPDPDEKTFTQIFLNKDRFILNFYKDKDEYAVFMHKKDTKGKLHYYFYGVFKRQYINNKAGICIFKRTVTALEASDWIP